MPFKYNPCDPCCDGGDNLDPLPGELERCDITTPLGGSPAGIVATVNLLNYPIFDYFSAFGGLSGFGDIQLSAPAVPPEFVSLPIVNLPPILVDSAPFSRFSVFTRTTAVDTYYGSISGPLHVPSSLFGAGTIEATIYYQNVFSLILSIHSYYPQGFRERILQDKNGKFFPTDNTYTGNPTSANPTVFNLENYNPKTLEWINDTGHSIDLGSKKTYRSREPLILIGGTTDVPWGGIVLECVKFKEPRVDWYQDPNFPELLTYVSRYYHHTFQKPAMPPSHSAYSRTIMLVKTKYDKLDPFNINGFVRYAIPFASVDNCGNVEWLSPTGGFAEWDGWPNLYYNDLNNPINYTPDAPYLDDQTMRLECWTSAGGIFNAPNLNDYDVYQYGGCSWPIGNMVSQEYAGIGGGIECYISNGCPNPPIEFLPNGPPWTTEYPYCS